MAPPGRDHACHHEGRTLHAHDTTNERLLTAAEVWLYEMVPICLTTDTAEERSAVEGALDSNIAIPSYTAIPTGTITSQCRQASFRDDDGGLASRIYLPTQPGSLHRLGNRPCQRRQCHAPVRFCGPREPASSLNPWESPSDVM